MIYYLGLGSNIGDRLQFLVQARRLISNVGEIVRSSVLYETEPFGVAGQQSFLNAVCVLETTLRPFRLLRKVKAIECQLGRKRSLRWGPRNIDIDLVEWNGLSVKSTILSIPHDGLPIRNFIYYPLCDVLPGYQLRDGRTLLQLKQQSEGQGWIKPFKENW